MTSFVTPTTFDFITAAGALSALAAILLIWLLMLKELTRERNAAIQRTLDAIIAPLLVAFALSAGFGLWNLINGLI
jgi:hypothetical protein